MALLAAATGGLSAPFSPRQRRWKDEAPEEPEPEDTDLEFEAALSGQSIGALVADRRALHEVDTPQLAWVMEPDPEERVRKAFAHWGEDGKRIAEALIKRAKKATGPTRRELGEIADDLIRQRLLQGRRGQSKRIGTLDW